MKKMMILVVLVFTCLNISCQSPLNTARYADKIIVKDEGNIFLNGQAIAISDLASKLTKPINKEGGASVLISIDNPKYPIKYFIPLLVNIISANRQDLYFQAGEENSAIYSLYIPKNDCGKDPDTGKEIHSAAWFNRDIQGNLLQPSKGVENTLIIPSMPLAESESCSFEGKQVSGYSDIFGVLRNNKLFPDKISLVYSWRESSTINDFIVFLNEMKSGGVKFVEIRGTQLDILDKYELKIENTGE